MTTEGSHNDPYASSYLRLFFLNYSQGVPNANCAENDSKRSSDGIDFLTPIIPVVAANVTEEGPTERLRELTRKIVMSTRKLSDIALPFIDLYTDLLASTLSGKSSLRDAVLAAAKKIDFDVEASVNLANEKSG